MNREIIRHSAAPARHGRRQSSIPREIFSPISITQPAHALGTFGLGEAFCFFAPILQFLRFDLVGETCVSDLLILAALPIALLRHSERLRRRPVPTILACGILWLMAQMVTDLLRDSASVDYLRGWSKIVLLLANFAVVWMVACRTPMRFLLFGGAIAIGTILAFYMHPSTESLLAPWKFALGGPCSFLVLIAVSLGSKHRYLGVLLPLSGLAVLHAYEDVRSLAVITFVSAVFSVFHMALSKTAKSGRRVGRARLAVLALTVAGGVWSFTAVYSHYAEDGAFGEYAQRKLEAQTSGSGGLLLGGRGEILASSQAIVDSPFLGHGSWARDPVYSAILSARRAELGYKELDRSSAPRNDLIPAHSYLFGAWVEAGLAGAAFWLFVLGFTLHTLFKISGSEALLPLFAFAGFLQIWDIFFSPLGNPSRFTAPYFIAAMVSLSALRTSGGRGNEEGRERLWV